MANITAGMMTDTINGIKLILVLDVILAIIQIVMYVT